MNYSPREFESIKIKIEDAAKLIKTSFASREKRQESENIFLEFRRSQSPYELCRYILENSIDMFVLHQTLSTLQEATLREWPLLSVDFIDELQSYLFKYVAGQRVLEKYVQRAIFQAIAVFYKRYKLDSSSPNRVYPISKESNLTNLIENVIDLFESSTIKLKELSFSLLVSLFNEFSSSTKSTKLGLSSDAHFIAKCLFEKNELKVVLAFILRTLKIVVTSLQQNGIASINSLDADAKAMLMQLIHLTEQSFLWEFTIEKSNKNLLKNILGNQSSTNEAQSTIYTILEPAPDYAEIFLDQDLVKLLFKLYELVKDNTEIAHVLMQSIIQLSSLDGKILTEHETHTGSFSTRVKFLETYLESFLALYSRVQIQETEAYNLASLIQNLMSPSNIRIYDRISAELLEKFLNFVCLYTCTCFRAENTSQDESVANKYLESFEKVLSYWISLKDCFYLKNGANNDFYLNLTIKKYSYEIFKSFIESRFLLETQTGLNKEINILNRNEPTSIDDDNSSVGDPEDDLQRYKEVLYCIGEFAKCSLETCLPILAKCLNEKYIQLYQAFKYILENPNLYNSKTYNIDSHLASIYENIHWLLLITGFICYEVNYDSTETVKIPSEIMKFSSSYLHEINKINQLVAVIDEPSRVPMIFNITPNLTSIINLPLITKIEFNESEKQVLTDPLMSIFFSSFQLMEIETYALSLNASHLLSPQLASTLMWFLKGLSLSYLFMRENDYNDSLSVGLHTLFGQDTPSASVIFKFLLRKIQINFSLWSSENGIITATSEVLLEVARNKESSCALLKSEQFWFIAQNISNDWNFMSSNIKLITRSLTHCCVSNHSSEKNMLNTFLSVFVPRLQFFYKIKDNQIHNEKNIKEVMRLIEILCGIIEGTSKNIQIELLNFILPLLQQSLRILDLYHNYGEVVESILSMFHAVIEILLVQLKEDFTEARNQIYSIFLNLINLYCKHNSGKKSIEACAEEDYYNDICLFITLLNKLLNKDFDYNSVVQFAIENTFNTASSSNRNTVASAADIIILGLEFLIPLMNQDMLKFQTLSIQYFKLMSGISHSSVEKIFSRTFELFSVFMKSIEFGIRSGLGNEITRYCLECISPLCNHVFRNQLQQTNYGEAMKSVFQITFDSIFRNMLEFEFFDLYTSVLFSLICCFRDFYSILVNDLVTNFTDITVKAKIIEGFNALTPSGVSLRIDRRDRLSFASRFNVFCINTYGLLFIR